MPNINSDEPIATAQCLKVFKYQEQQHISSEDQEEFAAINIQFDSEQKNPPKFLGLCNEWTSYYIGATWLTENQAVVVTPKKISDDETQETDFMKMFLCALEFAPSSEYFSKFYGINFDEPQIETESLDEQLTPLLIVHYLWTLKKLVSKGLKKNYIVREENLKSKVRGRILIQKNLQKNIFTQRFDRVYCKFQEYTVDIPENQLLKKALLFSQNYLSKFATGESEIFTEIVKHINKIKPAFSHVSDEIKVYEIKSIRKNKLFKEYTEAIRLAKMVLQRFDYSITKSNSNLKSVPPFWIDMSRLFEVYVYSKLYDAYGDSVMFQVNGSYGEVDFIKVDEQLILDTKYKPKYQNGDYNIDDIRQLSGYARDDKILKKMGLPNKTFDDVEYLIRCVIIYPDSQVSTVFDKPITNLIRNHEISGFRKFYTLCITLPTRLKR